MCNIMNMDSIYNANPSEWENLKYLNICYHGEDADMYEAELKRLFPDCEITLD